MANYKLPEITKAIYKPIENNKVYIILVSRLPLSLTEYCVSIHEDYSDHDNEIHHLDLHCYGHRRWLEKYIQNIKSKSKIAGVYFGNGSCLGDNHYPLEIYIRDYYKVDFLKDLNITL